MWVLRAFTADYSRTVVAEWFSLQTGRVQGAFETRLKFLIGQPRSVWKRPYVGTLTRECKGLYEIRLKVDNVQHRPIGYYSGELEFTILVFATERDWKLVPKNVCGLANERRALIERDGRHAREITFEE
jgi:hypothetical protein